MTTCSGCGSQVGLTKDHRLKRHGQKRDGRRVVSVCPMSGTMDTEATRRAGEIRKWEVECEQRVDALIDGATP
jgi:hypothetical protein